MERAVSAYEAWLLARVEAVVEAACIVDDNHGLHVLDDPSTPKALADELVGLITAPLAALRSRHDAMCRALGVSEDTAPHLLLGHAAEVYRTRHEGAARAVDRLKMVQELLVRPHTVDGDVLADLVRNQLPSQWSDEACDEFAERLLRDLRDADTTILRGPDSLPWTPTEEVTG